MTVVSGKDIDEIESMLDESMTEIEAHTTKQALVYNARDEVIYTQRFYIKNSLEARLWEFVALSADGAFVVLIANQFDRDDPLRNRKKRSVVIDTVLDLFDAWNVRQIMAAYSRHRSGYQSRAGVRELFPHMSQLYYYDTDGGEITYVKG